MFEIIFKALGEPTRLRILRLLAEQELCVCDLEEILQISQPRVSQHLKVLKQTGLVNERRDGQRRNFSFNHQTFQKVFTDFETFMKVPLKDLPEYKDICLRIDNLDENICEKKQQRNKQTGGI